MIVFDLKCNRDHTFEGWFRSSDDFDMQSQRKLIECPSCGSSNVNKAIMAPNVAPKGNQKSDVSVPVAPEDAPVNVAEAGIVMAGDGEFAAAIAPELPQELQDQMEELFAKVQKHVEENCTYVGNEFSNEARKIHYGESDSNGIYGEATEEETAELLEEGIEILPLPAKRKTHA